jgi:hypothetical protein
MRFFSRVVFLCNCCFIIAVILRFVELRTRTKGAGGDLALKFQPLESTVVVLGYGAIFVNIVYVFLSLYWLGTGKIRSVPRWLLLFNLLLFPLQVYYFFFSNY